MLKIDPYATHLPLLVACVSNTEGPVLELGCGLYSTPVLHALCHKRPLVTVELDPVWFAEFKGFSSQNHHVILVEDLSEIPDYHWSVVLVDQQPAAARVPSIKRYREKAELIVAHDTEHRLYGYEEVLPTFNYRVEWKRYAPWTSVVSDTVKLDWLGGVL